MTLIPTPPDRSSDMTTTPAPAILDAARVSVEEMNTEDYEPRFSVLPAPPEAVPTDRDDNYGKDDIYPW